MPYCDTSIVRWSVLLFSKLIKLFFGYFDPVKYFLIVKINNFRGDLSSISAKMATVQAGSLEEQSPASAYLCPPLHDLLCGALYNHGRVNMSTCI